MEVEESMSVTEITENNKAQKYNFIACNCCHATTLPLIKATDSYYCKFCFDKLHKEKFKKKRSKK